jgi:hypothetical protein
LNELIEFTVAARLLTGNTPFYRPPSACPGEGREADGFLQPYSKLSQPHQ